MTKQDNYDRVRYIIQQVEQGRYLVQALREKKMCSNDFFEVVDNDPELTLLYVRAERMRAETHVNTIESVARGEVGSTGDVQRDKLIVETLKWTASKLFPRKYGEHVDVTTNHQPIRQLSDAEFAEKLAKAKKILED